MELCDVFIYNANYDDMVELDNSWFGRVLIENDQFEGIVREYYDERVSFIYGNIHGNELSFIQCSMTESFPHRFEGTKEKSKFEGISYVTDGNTKIALGDCTVAVIPAEKTREITDFETERLKQKIEEWKGKLSIFEKQLYQSWKEQPKQFLKK